MKTARIVVEAALAIMASKTGGRSAPSATILWNRCLIQLVARAVNGPGSAAVTDRARQMRVRRASTVS